jgi:hypothetical protein
MAADTPPISVIPLIPMGLTASHAIRRSAVSPGYRALTVPAWDPGFSRRYSRQTGSAAQLSLRTAGLPAVKRTMTLLRSQARIDDGDRSVLCGRRAPHAQKA